MGGISSSVVKQKVLHAESSNIVQMKESNFN